MNINKLCASKKTPSIRMYILYFIIVVTGFNMDLSAQVSWGTNHIDKFELGKPYRIYSDECSYNYIKNNNNRCSLKYNNENFRLFGRKISQIDIRFCDPNISDFTDFCICQITVVLDASQKLDHIVSYEYIEEELPIVSIMPNDKKMKMFTNNITYIANRDRYYSTLKYFPIFYDEEYGWSYYGNGKEIKSILDLELKKEL